MNVALDYLNFYFNMQIDWFDQLDFIVCLIFSFVYTIKLYVSQHRI